MDSIDEQRLMRLDEQLREILHVLRMHVNHSNHLAEMTVLRLQADIYERMPKRS